MYIRFKTENDEWSNEIRIPDGINTEAHETSPFITPDGAYLFFGRNQDIYWVKAGFVERLKQQGN